MPIPDRMAGFKLLETGTLVEFQVMETKVQPLLDGETSYVRIEIQMGGTDGGNGEDQAEWGSFGFMFTLAVLSFGDARPRGNSEPDFIKDDEFAVADFFDGLRFERGELSLETDYIRGRCMKTTIIARRDGRVTLETRARGESALQWVDRLKGKKALELVQ